MSTLSYASSDSAVMFRRSLRRILRYPSMTLILVGMPLVFLLLFVYVLGGTLGAGLVPDAAGASGGRADYVAYVVPGILVLTVAAAAQGTAITVAMDMTEGIIARFKTMPISRSSVLTGHVLGSLVQSVAGVVVVLAVALLMGFRPSAGVVDWLLTLALIILISIAVIWLCVALGLVSKSVESASNLPMFLTLLPFFGSGFVPTKSMPVGLRLLAEYQPFTPMIEALRGLLAGVPDAGTVIIAIVWCLAISIGGYVWARILYRRPRVR
jgi:ABC-2 type transport system permease protein